MLQDSVFGFGILCPHFQHTSIHVYSPHPENMAFYFLSTHSVALWNEKYSIKYKNVDIFQSYI